MGSRSYLILFAVVCVFLAAVVLLCVFMPMSEAPHGEEPSDIIDESTDAPTEPPTEAPTERVTDAPTAEVTDPPETLPPLPEDGVREYDSFTVSGRYIPSEDAAAGVSAAIEAFGRPTGFIAVDIETGMTISRDADKKFAPASVVKAVYSLFCFRQIDAGEASLDETLTYTKSDVVYGDGVIGKMGVGAKLSLRDVLYHTLNTSDNEGYYMLLRRFGRTGVDEMTSALGCKTCKFKNSRWPQISCRDLAVIWAEIYRYRDETDGGRLLYEMLTNVEKMHFFRDALDCVTANKSGWNAESYNEGGIVYGDRTYILVVLTEGSYWTANKTQFGDIVRSINKMMSEYAAFFEPEETK